tara:strand:- start:909 stop:1418 length:510 start_codon:yes stop_codon:yes gene_type:complete
MQFMIFVGLCLLMLATRFHHFLETADASWAAFFIGGFYLFSGHVPQPAWADDAAHFGTWHWHFLLTPWVHIAAGLHACLNLLTHKRRQGIRAGDSIMPLFNALPTTGLSWRLRKSGPPIKSCPGPKAHLKPMTTPSLHSAPSSLCGLNAGNMQPDLTLLPTATAQHSMS